MASPILPEISVPVTDARGGMTVVWYRFFKLFTTLPVKVPSYTVASAPSASEMGAGSIIYVSNETGGAVLAFSDGADWRRVTDRNVIA